MPAGPVALITGGTDGIGKACALRLAAQGTVLILVGRNEDKGQRALNDIRAAVAGANVTCLAYDLALMRSVSDLVDTVLTHYPDLNLVVQCAGAMRARRTMTAEGLEMVFAVQYLARFLLSQKLGPLLAGRGRMVSISAAGTMPLHLDYRNLNGERFYNGLYALIQESVANDLFALRLWRENPDLHFYNYGPFYIKTALFNDMPFWFRIMTGLAGPLVATTVDSAARDIVDLLTGDYPAGMYSRRLKPIRPSRYRANSVEQDRLWAASERLVQDALAGPEPQPPPRSTP